MKKGVILFADNDVFNLGTFENLLFEKLSKDSDFAIVPISELSSLETVLEGTSTFKALIVDWNFSKDEKEDFDGLDLPPELPDNLLKNNKIYSLIYVYSQTDIPQETKSELEGFYPNKIKFRIKDKESVDTEYESILTDIREFDKKSQHMKVPLLWGKMINKSVHQIFSDLENANPNWITELSITATEDNAEPISEVINIFNQILNESLIQNSFLRDALEDFNRAQIGVTYEDQDVNTAKLYRHIYYTKISENTPISTGDIFKFSDNEYAILVTPECDIVPRKEVSKKQKDRYEFLLINKEASDIFKKEKIKSYKKNQNTNNEKHSLEFFNNGVASRHVLVGFPFNSDVYNDIALINFVNAMYVYMIKDPNIGLNELKNSRINYKVNAPYIHQIRQRYYAHMGRYGVPAIPDSLRKFNLSD